MSFLSRAISVLLVLAWCAVAPGVSVGQQLPATMPAAVVPGATAPLETNTRSAIEKPISAVEHVVIISIDGLRPDLALRADMPHLRSLLARGSYSFWARTTEISVTLPSHVSMLTGVKPERHGVSWNDSRSGPEDLKVPTIFDRAHAAGLSTALAASKVKFRIFAKAGVVDHATVSDDDLDNDAATASNASKLLTSYKPNLLFVHFGEVDGVGHGIGWGTPEQIARIEKSDERLGVVLKGIDDAGLRDGTVVIVTADHGGSGRQHGRDDLRSRHIPWVCAGPGVAPGFDLTFYRDLTINTEDTFATACWLLGIDLGENPDGKPVKWVLADKGDLLEPTPGTPATTQAKP